VTYTDMPTVVICDTWGAEPDPRLVKDNPLVEFVALDPHPPAHPHGHQCAELVCLMARAAEKPFRIVFDPWLSRNNRDERQWYTNLLRVRDRYPSSKIFQNNSWGAHHQKDRLLMDWQERQWADGNRFREVTRVLEEVDAELVFAAGNDDGKRPGHSDQINDICQPQRALSASQRVAVIGSNDPDGRPSFFSADGPEVLGMYPGERIRTLDPAGRGQISAFGTSFSAPLATGDALYNWLTSEDARHDISVRGFQPWFKDWFLLNAATARGWPRGVHHPKGGHGSMNAVVRRRVRAPVLAGNRTKMQQVDYGQPTKIK
jgi:hypothetical protein